MVIVYGSDNFKIYTMSKILTIIAIMLLCGCSSMKHYSVFQCDNGDDYVSEGLYRIVDKRGVSGTQTKAAGRSSSPASPSASHSRIGKAKVTDKGEMKEVPGSDGEYHYWERRRMVLYRQERAEK